MAITTNTANTTVTDRTASGNQPDNTPATGTTTGGSGGSGVSSVSSGSSNVTVTSSGGGGTGAVTISVSGGSGTGNVTGSGTTTLGHVAVFNNTSATGIQDGGPASLTIAGNPVSLGGSVSQDSITGLAATTAGIVKHTATANTLGIAVAADFPTLNQNTTGNAATVTGLSVASGKTLTANNTLTLSGTDGSTLAIGGGGTLGSAAYTASTAYVAASSGTATNLTLAGTLKDSNSSSAGSSGQVLSSLGTGTKWITPSSGGNVTGTSPTVSGNVAVFNNTTGTGIQDGGTLGTAAFTASTAYVSATTTQTAHKFLAGPTTGTAAPTFRVIDPTDVPTLNQSTTGNAATATTATTATTAGNVTGIVAVANGGTGTSGPSLINGTGISVTGSWPNQTITNTTAALPSGGSTSKSLLYGTSSAAWYTEHFNVQAFGATGNGSTDDTTNINSAIAALNAAGGGELYFPKGTYYISATLTTITVPCKIYGAGVQSSSITQHTLTAGVFLITTTLACVIRDINVTSTGTSTGYGISFNPTSYNSSSLINNISVGGFSICLYLNVAFAIVDGCTFGSSTTCVYYTNAVLPDESCGTILNCTFNTSGGTQCIYMEADGLQIMNNYFYAGGSYAIVYNVIANCTNVSDLWIQNNHIEGYSSIAVWIKSPSGYPFSNLQITNNEFSPIVNSTATAIQIDAQGASPAWVSGAYYLTYNCVSYGGVNYELVQGATVTTAGSFVTGRKYKIVDVNNTDFTLIGAAANIANVSFTATGSGTGTGTASNFTSTTIPPSDTANWAALPYYLQNANLTGNVITSGTTAFSLNGINNATVSANSIQAVTYGVLTGYVTNSIVSRANSFYGVTYPIYDVGTKNFSDLWTGKGVNVTQQNSGGTGFSIANNTETNVSWNRSLYDDGGFYGASTFWSSGNADRITIPSNAYIVGIKRIQLTACINWDPNATGNRQIKIKDNNGNTYGGNLIAGGNTSDFASDYNSTLTCMIDISSMGNPTYFFVTGTQDSGGALNVRSSYGSFFCMEIKC